MQLTALSLALTRIGLGGFGVGSSLNLDFTSGNQALDPRITFTRASTGTRINASGVLESVEINGPRFDYDPVTLAPRGLLIEEQRTNLLTWSEQFDNAAWLKSNTTITTNVISAPDGSTTADKIEATASAPTSLFQSLALTGSACTGSVYVKKGSGANDANRFYIRDNTAATTLLAVAIDYDTRAITYVAGTTGADVVDVGNGWLRVTLSVASGLVSENNLRFGVCFIGNNETAGEFAYAWGAQLEAGAFPTSYIPTSGAAATRAADVAVMTGANFSNWYRQDEGTLFAEAATISTATNAGLLSAEDATTNNRIQLRRNASGPSLRAVVSAAGVVTVNTAGGVFSTSATKVAAAYKVDDFVAAISGSVVITDTSVTVPSANNQIVFGAGSGQSALNGHIRRIAYFPRRLSNAELQGITSCPTCA